MASEKQIARPAIHKAQPVSEFAEDARSTCVWCHREIKRVPGGQGSTWVHADSGAVVGHGAGSVTDEQVVADRLDLEMIERPHLWPHQDPVPMLFLKRSVADGDGLGYQVARCVQREGGGYFVKADFTDDNPAVFEYDSAAEVRAAGWIVD